MAAEQLWMPWGVPVHRPLDEVTLTGLVDLRVAIWRRGPTVGLDAASASAALDPQQRFELRLRVDEAAPTCTVNGQPADWSLSADLESFPGCFLAATKWIVGRLVPGSWREAVYRRHPAVVTLQTLAERVAREAVGQCEPRARALALRFAPPDRFHVYAALVADPTGRVADLIETAPGLLALSAWLVRRGHPDRARAVLQPVREGKRLRLALDAGRAAWAAIAEPGAAATPATVQRLWWRRFPPELFAELAAAPFSPSTAPSDIPRDPLQRPGWYRLVAALASDPQLYRLPAPAQRRLAGFVSAHGAELTRLQRDRRDGAPDAFVRQLLDYLHHEVVPGNRPIPCRRSAPERVLAAVDDWHVRMWAHAAPQLPPDTELPLGPCREVEAGALRLHAIRSVGELIAEGARMHHCVSAHAEDCAAGLLYVFSGHHGSERLTVAIAPSPDGWLLIEASGFANREASAEARLSIQRWLVECDNNERGG